MPQDLKSEMRRCMDMGQK